MMLKDLSSITVAWLGILLSTAWGQMALYLAIAAVIVASVFGFRWPQPEREDGYVIELKSNQATNIIFTVEESE